MGVWVIYGAFTALSGHIKHQLLDC